MFANPSVFTDMEEYRPQLARTWMHVLADKSYELMRDIALHAWDASLGRRFQPLEEFLVEHLPADQIIRENWPKPHMSDQHRPDADLLSGPPYYLAVPVSSLAKLPYGYAIKDDFDRFWWVFLSEDELANLPTEHPNPNKYTYYGPRA